jgi:o-succinylbenzoate---CoA ligase
MTDYPHSDIIVNGRSIDLAEIAEGKATGWSHAEANAFSFIREWCKGVREFALQTSGSTGSPKQITVTRDQMVASARLTEQALNLKRNWTALLCLDARYIAGRMMIVRSFITGMKLFIIDPCANPLEKIPPTQPMDFTAIVPYQLISILESKHPHSLDKFKIALVGGAPLDDATILKLGSHSAAIYLTYGMTETISHVALRRLNGHGAQRYFETLPGVKIGTDVRGCLVINAPFLEKEVVTSDIVEIFNTNQFVWRGRYDNVINSGGIKISPEEVERKIGKIFTRLNLTNHFFIHHLPDGKLGQRAVMVIESPLPDASALDELIESILHSFSPHEAPRELYESFSFILTDTGKINRRATLGQAQFVRRFHR